MLTYDSTATLPSYLRYFFQSFIFHYRVELGEKEIMIVENDLARDFGFDIAMPDGNVGLPSAAHKLFMEQCKVLYREFMTNMSVHMKTEKQLKRSLRSLHEEKLRNLRFSLYRSESADPFARRPEVESSTACIDSRGNTPWGLDTIPDEDDQGGQRPQTAPASACRKGMVSSQDMRPKTAGATASNNIPDDDDSDSGLSDMSAATKSTIMGVVDRKAELGSNRKITVGQRSFTKITHGNVMAKLKHKEGKFVVKPVKVDLDREAANSDTMAYDPIAAKQKFDPVTERLALVRKLTNFKTPTISSDMKINNRVPIQKCLRGIDAKRITISEIYQNARDRSARHFRIVTNKPERMARHDEREINGRMLRPDLSNRWVKALRASFSVGPGGVPGDGAGGESSNPRESDETSPGNHQSRPRSILLYSGSGGSKSLGESFSAKELAENAFLNVYQDVTKRPQSKVAFVRTDSELSNDNVFINDNIDCSASANGTLGQQVHSPNSNGGKTSVHSAVKKAFLSSASSRARAESGNSESELRSRAGSVSRSDRRGPHDNNAHGTERQLSTSETGKQGGKQFLSVNNLPGQGERPQSVSSNGTGVMPKNKQGSSQKNGGNGKRPKTLERTLSASMDAPSKLESTRDTVKIVKQQMRMDKVLDERMAVWRRRMAVKSSAMNTKLRPSPRRGKLI